jgi:hypothetical protein
MASEKSKLKRFFTIEFILRINGIISNEKNSLKTPEFFGRGWL